MKHLIVALALASIIVACSDDPAAPEYGKVAGVLRGRTGRDPSTAIPIPNATVSVEPGGMVITTGRFGEYVFDRPTLDTVLLTASATGYETLVLCLPPIFTSRTIEMGFVELPRVLTASLTSVDVRIVSMTADTAVVSVRGTSAEHDLMSVAIIAADAPPPDTAFTSAPQRSLTADGVPTTLRVAIKGAGAELYAVVAAGRSYVAEPWFCGALTTGLGPRTVIKLPR